MDEASIEARRAFIRLDARDRALLGEMTEWADGVAPEIAREFYDWQFAFPNTRQFFEALAAERKMPLPVLRKHLEGAQAGYMREIFAGAEVNWDLRYFEKRLQVSLAHDRVNLPFKWYVGSYPEYKRLFGKYLYRDLDKSRAEQIEAALDRVFNLDLQAIGDAFLLNTLERMLASGGIALDDVCGSGDRTEQVGIIKQAMSNQLHGFIGAMKHMAAEHDRGEIDVTIPPENFVGAFATMANGVNAMVRGHITVNTKAMACVAEFGKGNFKAPLELFPGKKAFINETIEQMRGNLMNLITEMSQSASALAASSEKLTVVSRQMAGNAEETASQVNLASAVSEEVSNSVNSVAAATSHMQTSIREISRNANESALVARNAVSVASATNHTVKKLGDSSHEIGKVVKVITSIAQQTNLLALNATIEAARAGAAGKGFAVVAHEVKELARQTARATEEIGQKIEAIQGDSKGAVKAIEEIGVIVNQINDISNSIAAAVEEQTFATNEIGRSVAEAAQGVREIGKNIDSVAVAAKSTRHGANDTQKASLQLSSMASGLERTVSKFTF
jgi:methyl-accepting chemotaxis protein